MGLLTAAEMVERIKSQWGRATARLFLPLENLDMNVSLIRQRFAAAMERGMSVADATAYANSLFGPLRTPGKLAAPSKPVETKTADPDPVQGDSGTNLDNPRGEPVEIPADWKSMQWMKQEKLAAEIVGATVPLATAEGQTRAQKAKAIIEAEVSQRASKG